MQTLSRSDIALLLNKKVPQFSGKTLYIMGGGNTTQLFQEGLRRESFYEQVAGYTNSNPENWGKMMFGKPCVNPETLCGKEDVLVLINTPQPRYIKEMDEKLNWLNIPHCLLEEAVLRNHAAEVLEVYDLLIDQKSRDIYANMLYCRLRGTYPDHDCITANQYFCWSDFTNTDIGTSFVDCGAYVGDSLERYIWYKDGVVKKLFAFEPDPNNFRAMKVRSERLKNEWNISEQALRLFPYGVAEKTTEGIVQNYGVNNGLGSKIVQGVASEGESIKIVALDDVLDEDIDFLKADIESYEYKMLLGAEKTIRRCRPNIAVCIYHNSTDFYSVPLLVHKMMPDAKLAVRHHSNTLADTVLYAFA